MKKNNATVLPLYFFFDRLRINDFAMGIREYELFLFALQKVFGLGLNEYNIFLKHCLNQSSPLARREIFPKDELLSLCRLLWLKPGKSVLLFERLFEETYFLDFEIGSNSTIATDDKKIINEEKEINNIESKQEETDDTPSITNNISLRIAIGEYDDETDFGLDKNAIVDAKKKTFLFSNNYYPIDRRKMEQNFRRLVNLRTNGHSQNIDIELTISKIVENGRFLNACYQKNKENNINLILLIDHSGSMIAFHQLIDTIKKVIENSLAFNKHVKYNKIKSYYFYNSPNKYIYLNIQHTKFEEFDKVMTRLKNKLSYVIFISDAGAARGNYNLNRIMDTELIIDKIKKVTNKMVWLNPMPKLRWESTSADEISNVIPMFEADEIGIKNAVNILRGNTNIELAEA